MAHPEREVKVRWFRRTLTDKELAEELHNCGLDAWHQYKVMGKMGKSADKWNFYRLDIARELLRRLDIRQK